MENSRYERIVEEALTIKRRNRRDQGRLMILFKEAADANMLEQFCADTGYTTVTANNYLAAHRKFADELGIVPGSGPGVDGLIEEMWDDVYDATLFDKRYWSVDKEGIINAAEELGLRGPSKALDFGKNLPSLKAAVIGDGRVADAATEALFLRMKNDPELRERVEAEMIRTWRLSGRMGKGRSKAHDEKFFQRIYDKLRSMARTAHDMEDIPDHLLGYAEGRLIETRTVIDEAIVIVKGRRALEEV